MSARLDRATAELIDWCAELHRETRQITIHKIAYKTPIESEQVTITLGLAHFRELWREYSNALLADYAERALQRTRGAAGGS